MRSTIGALGALLIILVIVTSALGLIDQWRDRPHPCKTDSQGRVLPGQGWCGGAAVSNH